ncbi:ABC transporter permease [Herbiconiux sp. CPCC 203407]|uniref:ABC transporter permease n=1 Tax=Herbiconiux oxytropis TaxID=2970915 RepID=A0AA42BUJ5_9MICO|nr:ABC transporter permease [Herbiconiux oxytropis]MCS5724085.1 ABC transporter permease [Herbiconiux oxytropis]MCS5726982.1 ABC transporter permease [Herbiconiux oxytropis]
MTSYLTTRVVRMLITVLAVVLVTFFLTQIAFSNPARNLAPPNASAETIQAIARAYGIDRPWPEQLFGYFVKGPDIQGTPTGLLNWPPSLGYSYQEQRPVTELLLEKIPATLSLAAGAFVLWIGFSVLFGVLAARRQGGVLDKITSAFSYTFLSLPTFVTGMLLIYVLFYQLSLAGFRFFPSSGYVPITESVGEWARHLILPWLTLALAEIAIFQRVIRSSVLEVVGQDYIRTAKAKGLPDRRVYFGHALSGALNPVLTLGGIELAAIIGGAVITEQVFGIDGIGRLAVSAASSGDAPVVIGITLFSAMVFVVATFAVDLITYARSSRQ